MTDKNSISNYLKILINGILMGTANKIPGVSGGLVAIAIGFYEELIFSLKRFDNSTEKLLFHGHTFSIEPMTNPSIIV